MAKPQDQTLPEDMSIPVEEMERVEVMHHLLKLTNRLMAPFSMHLEKRYRITLNEFRVLMMIGKLETTASHELAGILGVNTMAVSRAVASLSRQGRIAVDTDPQSRRRKILRLTDRGRLLYADMMPASLQVADYLFEALRPHEVMAFDHYVRSLTDRLEATDEDGHSVFLERTRPDALKAG